MRRRRDGRVRSRAAGGPRPAAGRRMRSGRGRGAAGAGGNPGRRRHRTRNGRRGRAGHQGSRGCRPGAPLRTQPPGSGHSHGSALGARRSALGARRSALGARRSALGARRSALGARRSALGARRSALGARRSALGARRSALGARRSALGARRSALGARRSALGARRSALGARRSALGARRSALGARRSALGARRSALGARRSALGARRSALGARRSALGARRSALGARRSALGARRSALGARRSALGARRSALYGKPERFVMSILCRVRHRRPYIQPSWSPWRTCKTGHDLGPKVIARRNRFVNNTALFVLCDLCTIARAVPGAKKLPADTGRNCPRIRAETASPTATSAALGDTSVIAMANFYLCKQGRPGPAFRPPPSPRAPRPPRPGLPEGRAAPRRATVCVTVARFAAVTAAQSETPVSSSRISSCTCCVRSQMPVVWACAGAGWGQCAEEERITMTGHHSWRRLTRERHTGTERARIRRTL